MDKKNDKKRWLSKHLIYKVKRPIYGADYSCCTPMVSALSEEHAVVGVWVCDSQGNLHPGYKVSSLPMIVTNIGEAVNDWPAESEVYE